MAVYSVGVHVYSIVFESNDGTDYELGPAMETYQLKCRNCRHSENNVTNPFGVATLIMADSPGQDFDMLR